MIALLLYVVFGLLLLFLYRKKAEAHLEFLASIDLELKRFSSVFDLSKSQKMDHKIIAFKIMLPFFYVKHSQILTVDQKHLKNKLKRALIKFYLGIVLMIVFFELWFKIF